MATPVEGARACAVWRATVEGWEVMEVSVGTVGPERLGAMAPPAVQSAAHLVEPTCQPSARTELAVVAVVVAVAAAVEVEE